LVICGDSPQFPPQSETEAASEAVANKPLQYALRVGLTAAACRLSGYRHKTCLLHNFLKEGLPAPPKGSGLQKLCLKDLRWPGESILVLFNGKAVEIDGQKHFRQPRRKLRHPRGDAPTQNFPQRSEILSLKNITQTSVV
jgi:hypothetical protein